MADGVAPRKGEQEGYMDSGQFLVSLAISVLISLLIETARRKEA